MATIIFEHVVKRFDQTLVLKDLSFCIADEEFVVLVGPSGCGKSTALRIIAGLEDVSEGRLCIGERLVNDVPPKDRDVAMVFQSYALYPHMNVRENISFGLRLRKFPKDEIERMVNEAAKLLGLQELLDRKPKALSGGQRQRVALGRAIVRKPAVFLFDEPLSNLDAELRVQMRAEISKLQRRLKTTMVYVTHDQVEAMTMGHRIAVLAPVAPGMQTNLKQIGTPLELYDRPQNVFVAHFIGTPNMNILRGTLNEDGSRVNSAALVVPVPEEFRAAAAVRRGQAVVLGVRPEHIGDAREHDWPRTVPIRGSVEIVETIGHEVIVHLRSGEDRIIAKLRAARRIPDFGESMELVVNADAVHLFEVQTELRLA